MLRQLYAGDVVHEVGEYVGDWVRVDFSTQLGQITGWVNGKYTRNVPCPFAAPVPVAVRPVPVPTYIPPAQGPTATATTGPITINITPNSSPPTIINKNDIKVTPSPPVVVNNASNNNNNIPYCTGANAPPFDICTSPPPANQN
jgi:hypothetical protein